MLSSNVSGADVSVQPGPTDTTSDLSFCPVAEFFAASSWDNAVCHFSLFCRFPLALLPLPLLALLPFRTFPSFLFSIGPSLPDY